VFNLKFSNIVDNEYFCIHVEDLLSEEKLQYLEELHKQHKNKIKKSNHNTNKYRPKNTWDNAEAYFYHETDNILNKEIQNIWCDFLFKHALTKKLTKLHVIKYVEQNDPQGLHTDSYIDEGISFLIPLDSDVNNTLYTLIFKKNIPYNVLKNNPSATSDYLNSLKDLTPLLDKKYNLKHITNRNIEKTELLYGFRYKRRDAIIFNRHLLHTSTFWKTEDYQRKNFFFGHADFIK
jgi:hypothetical protein